MGYNNSIKFEDGLTFKSLMIECSKLSDFRDQKSFLEHIVREYNYFKEKLKKELITLKSENSFQYLHFTLPLIIEKINNELSFKINVIRLSNQNKIKIPVSTFESLEKDINILFKKKKWDLNLLVGDPISHEELNILINSFQNNTEDILSNIFCLFFLKKEITNLSLEIDSLIKHIGKDSLSPSQKKFCDNLDYLLNYVQDELEFQKEAFSEQVFEKIKNKPNKTETTQEKKICWCGSIKQLKELIYILCTNRYIPESYADESNFKIIINQHFCQENGISFFPNAKQTSKKEIVWFGEERPLIYLLMGLDDADLLKIKPIESTVRHFYSNKTRKKYKINQWYKIRDDIKQIDEKSPPKELKEIDNLIKKVLNIIE